MDTMTKKTIAFYTLGCRLNQSETAVIENTFNDNYAIVPFKDGAEIVIINTCTVTENGDADARRLVNKAVRLNKDVKVAMIGCQAQVQKEKLLKLPNVQWVIGNAKKMDVASIIEEIDNQEPRVITPTISKESFTIPMAGIDRRHTRANIKIQDGCDFFCTFCEIPYARGRARSRVFEDILVECRALIAAGHKEIIITGINLGTYDNDGKDIYDVIRAMEELEGLERIRISSIEPTTIPDDLIKMMNGSTKLCRYLHIPIQSASDVVLESMKRKYNYAEFADFILKVKSINPEICIGTDVIVGFPTETEEEFLKTEDRLRELPIDYFHVFSYSKRYMAKSRSWDEEVPIHLIQERSQRLRDLSQRKRHMFFETQMNKPQEIIVEEKKKGKWTGLTDHYIRILFESNNDLKNQTVNLSPSINNGTHIYAVLNK
ncbi:MAG: threonylcarbamoyladenosine tRNA methylthiotransferase MtaB [Candidatus Omnitrophota bacterium]|jgi:threonylcarbamoyladenosine tRNA methylthiotransferase MtaB